MRRSKTAIKRLFGILMSMIMILGMMTTTAFAADGVATITINKGTIKTDWKGMTVNAYMVLDQVNPNEEDSAKKQYAVTDEFKDFFNIDEVKEAFDGTQLVYLNYNNSTDGNCLVAGSTDTTESGGFQITNNAALDEKYPEADLISRMSSIGGQIGTFYTWIEKYIESKSLTKTLSITAGSDNTVGWTNLNEGYYALTFSGVPNGILVKQGILVATPGTMTLKAEEIPVTKTVSKDEQDFQEEISTALNTPLTYQIESEVPTLTDYDNLEYFYFSDEMTRQKIDDGSFTLTIGGTPASTTDNRTFYINGEKIATLNLDMYGDAVVEDPDDPSKRVPGQTFTFNFTTSVLEKYQGKEIILKYQAKPTSDAVKILYNDVDLIYKNGPDEHKIPDQTKVYTYGIEVQKTFSDGSTDYNDVTFKLYQDNQGAQGTQIALVGGNGSYRVPVIDTKTGKPESGSTDALILDGNGKLIITGLDEGTYWLVETAAPDGFTVAKPIKIVLAKDSVSPSVLDKDDSTAKYNGEGDSLITGIGSQTNTQISLAQLTVLNQKGFSLPSTGGAGTWMLTIGGILLIAAAGGLYVIYRKKFAAK